ncbi:MAG: universal stress protein [Gammaproteobacteria bacterium]|nr:universal stress protein [Gammaproteobacteria bacterium]
MFEKILCPTDGSEHAEKAAALAGDLAAKYDAELVLVHVLMSHASSDDLRKFADIEGLATDVRPEIDRLRTLEQPMLAASAPARAEPIANEVLERIGNYALESAMRAAEAKGVSAVSTRLEQGDPGKRILECAEEEGADTIVMGSRGLGRIKGLLVGSVSQYVSSRAPSTCISVK